MRNNGCLWVFGLIWTSFILVFDYLGFRPLVTQWGTAHYLPAPALVLASEVEVDRSGSSTSYQARIRYQYTVEGKTLEGQRYRFFDLSNRKHAYGLVEHYSVGKATQAYYDPNEITRVVLKRGAEPNDFFLVLFLTPFHLVGLGLLLSAWPSRPSQTGFPISQRGALYSIKTHYTNPLISAFAGLGCLSMVMIFFNALLLKMNLSWNIVKVELALLVLVSLHSAVSQVRSNADLSLALTLDVRSRTLSYREQGWNLDAVDRIDVEEVDSGDSERANDYWLRLQLHEGSPVRVLKASNKQSLERLASWLNQQLPQPATRPLGNSKPAAR